jgi:hypothetical protein
MSSESPASILFSSDGYELAAVTATAIPTGTRGLLAMGSDGTNARFINVDSSARVITAGAGVAGTPAGGVLSIQGVAGGTAIPVSGSITANNASVSATGSAPPASATYIGGSVTTAAPTYTTGQMNALSLTTAGALRVDGSGATQPVSGSVTVSGTVTANQGTAAATASAWPIKLTDATNTASLLNTTPAGTEYGLVVRNIPSGTQTISGTVTANAGTGNFTVVQNTAANLNAAVVGTGVAGTPAGGVLTVQGASGATALPVTNQKAATSSLSNVPGSATSVTLLAANANRLGATIYNDSSSTLYVKYGTTASNSSFTIRLLAQAYHEVVFDYIGRIDGIWNASTGNARITELTA